MRRLFTFGCSFTRYHWPTYADIIGKEYDYFENWGNSGLGNKATLERLSEVVVHNTITADDTIIVQWTSPHRFDVHLPHKFPLDAWFTGGNMLNNPLFPEEWLQSYWNESSYVMHSLNFIFLATNLLNSLPCKWYMTTMNSFEKEIDTFPIFESYRKYINTDKWSPPMQDYFKNSGVEEKPFKKNVRDHHGKIIKLVDVWDPHPTPLVHYNYAKDFLEKELNIILNYEWAKQADELLSLAVTHEDIRDMYINNLEWNNRTNWKRGL